jgi:anti-sigma-K factor RskA
MDHEEAIRTNASIRYALGELSADERDSFEEHFADCSHCMGDVEASTVFAANTRAVFRERGSAGTRAKANWWFAWRPFPAFAFSAALNLVLVACLGYALLRTGTTPRAVVAESMEPQSVDVIPVHGATRGGEERQVVHVSPRPIVLTVDLPQSYERYQYSVEREKSTVMSGELRLAGHPESLNLQIPADRLAPGKYRVTITGTNGNIHETLGICLFEMSPK